ncbi:major facilitator superfamily domain-containing protein [Penicillium pulvis]|uniref:major facilitator superfamily domain-containing protein n=1 Tax=Penicillium pulvis TaxID=1562058 RepID=UPI0025477224|nr:major facilitator superfamily domain-containing protein [Penicillium pulvis]KAJ5813834.1 major facilitator superfamily domain-containing protein [Penicillium pulvis]
MSNAEGALLLAFMSFSQVAGNSVDLLLTPSSVIAAAASFALWGLADSLAPLVAFALVYGFFGAGYVAMWARMSTAISADPTASNMNYKEIGNVLTGPLSGSLYRQWF